MTKHGRDTAAEKLNLYISGYFDKLLDVIIEHGGEYVIYSLCVKGLLSCELTPSPAVVC